MSGSGAIGAGLGYALGPVGAAAGYALGKKLTPEPSLAGTRAAEQRRKTPGTPEYEEEQRKKAELEKKNREIQEAEALRVKTALEAQSVTSAANAWGINEEAYKAGYGRNQGRASTILAGGNPSMNSAGGLARRELYGR